MTHKDSQLPIAKPHRSHRPDQFGITPLSSARWLKAGLLMGGLLCATLFAWGTARAKTPEVTLHVVNEVPKFLKFYQAAESKHLDPAQRWALWKKDYGIAAVPPTPQGQKLARKRLESVWNKYHSALEQYPRNAVRDEASARKILPEVARLLKAGKHPIKVGLVLFVGEYSHNAYTVPGNGGHPATIYLPVEISGRWPRITLAHEFTHAVHAEVDGLKNLYVEPLGETVFKEGLAMHASRHIVPGGPPRDYTPAMLYGATWQKTCLKDQRAILSGMRPYLDKSSVQVIQQFTTGKGTTGLHDEVYCAGWVVVGKLLDMGYTYASLARIPEPKMPDFVAQAIRQDIRAKQATD
ncbi:MAG: hypothetical protein WCB49_12585 [Gammaproteobacteria bacterium]